MRYALLALLLSACLLYLLDSLDLEPRFQTDAGLYCACHDGMQPIECRMANEPCASRASEGK